MIGIIRNIILGALVIVLLAFVASFATVLLQTVREQKYTEQQRETVARELAEAQKELGRRESELKALQEDTEYLERVVRERLGYVRPNDTVFIFETPDAR